MNHLLEYRKWSGNHTKCYNQNKLSADMAWYGQICHLAIAIASQRSRAMYRHRDIFLGKSARQVTSVSGCQWAPGISHDLWRDTHECKSFPLLLGAYQGTQRDKWSYLSQPLWIGWALWGTWTSPKLRWKKNLWNMISKASLSESARGGPFNKPSLLQSMAARLWASSSSLKFFFLLYVLFPNLQNLIISPNKSPKLLRRDSICLTKIINTYIPYTNYHIPYIVLYKYNILNI